MSLLKAAGSSLRPLRILRKASDTKGSSRFRVSAISISRRAWAFFRSRRSAPARDGRTRCPRGRASLEMAAGPARAGRGRPRASRHAARAGLTAVRDPRPGRGRGTRPPGWPSRCGPRGRRSGWRGRRARPPAGPRRGTAAASSAAAPRTAPAARRGNLSGRRDRECHQRQREGRRRKRGELLEPVEGRVDEKVDRRAHHRRDQRGAGAVEPAPHPCSAARAGHDKAGQQEQAHEPSSPITRSQTSCA